ncbi:MAG: DUF3795 domain-containing protein [Clostridiales bacterium]|jgi:hypothetical protein|nr:DUF3795 domain-containing protein [Clostridiales bacterium]
MPEMICYCGHDCSKCVTYLATIGGDMQLKRKSTVFYKEEFNFELPLESIHCMGGRSDEVMQGCRDCPYKKCCREKNLSACSECTDYPCANLAWYIDKYVNKVNQVV